MASKACALCMRTIRRNPGSIPRTQNRFSYVATRSFTRQDIFQGELQEPKSNQKPSTSPGTPQPTEGEAKPKLKPVSSKMPIHLMTAKGIQKTAGESTETYTAYGRAEALYKECALQANYSIPQAKDEDAEMPKTEDGEDLGIGEGWWNTEAGLQPTFSTWSQVTMLHMYLLVARFRCFDTFDAQNWQQHLVEHFFYDAENRMIVDHNMHARGTRNKYLKDLFIQWRGLLAAYDEGIQRGDAVLAAAIWRNVFKANEEVDLRSLAKIVSYMRGTLKVLDEIESLKIMTHDIKFSGPEPQSQVADKLSPTLDVPFEAILDRKLPASFQNMKK